jgi:hypothetical protein
VDWIYLAQNRDHLPSVVNTVMKDPFFAEIRDKPPSLRKEFVSVDQPSRRREKFRRFHENLRWWRQKRRIFTFYRRWLRCPQVPLKLNVLHALPLFLWSLRAHISIVSAVRRKQKTLWVSNVSLPEDFSMIPTVK